jgi:hypothetical protein
MDKNHKRKKYFPNHKSKSKKIIKKHKSIKICFLCFPTTLKVSEKEAATLSFL